MSYYRRLWLCDYKWREDFLSDIIAGCTMTVIQIPQGMAYALLANCPPVVGIYTSIFPVIIYSLFGSSPHASKGTNALVCMLTGSIVLKYVSMYNATISAVSIVSSLSLLAGAWQILLAAVGFARASWILSDIFMSAFISGASVHIALSQISHLLGIHTQPSHDGQRMFQLMTKCHKIFERIGQLNWWTLSIGLSNLFLLMMYDFWLKSYLTKKLGFHFPVHIAIVALGSWLSGTFEFHHLHSVDIIGHLPAGLPSVAIPTVTLPWTVLVDSLKIAVVAFCISLSMAKALDKGYVGGHTATRELVADGLANICGSLFQCVPSATSMSRSFVQVQIQGRTQLTGLVSALVLMVASVTISHAFEPLPKAVLAAIILTCLKGAFMNFGDFAKYYHISKADGVLWLSIMIAVVLTTPDLGMAVGVALNVCSMAYRAHDASFDVTHGKLVGGGHVITVSGTVIFSNVEKLLDHFIILAERSLHNSVMIIDLTHCHYVDQISAKVLSNGFQYPSIKTVFIVYSKDQVKVMFQRHPNPRIVFVENLDAVLSQIQSENI